MQIIKKWADVVEIISGKNQKNVVNPKGKYPIYGSGGVIGYADNFLCEAGTTIVGRKGTINNPIYVEERFWNVDTAFGIYPKRDVLPKYLFFFCQLFNFKTLDKSTTIPSLAKRDLLNIEMPVPTLSEQERIITYIEEKFSLLESGVEILKKTKQKLAIYRQSVLKEAFDGKFTENSHVAISEELQWATNEEIENLPDIPKEWRYISLYRLGELGRGRSKHRPRNDVKLFENGKYPFLQTGEIKAAGKYITEYSKMYGEFGLKQSKLWAKGTLCITIAANIAETAFLGIDACFPDSVVGFTSSTLVVPTYIKYFIESQKLRLWAYAPATAQKNINLDTLENLIVPYCNIVEQNLVVREIEARLSVCDNIEKTVEIALQQAEAMRQGILKSAFEGGFHHE